MDALPEVPAGIKNVPLWEERCRKIHARAKDFTDGKIGLIEVASLLRTLAMQTKAPQDEDFAVFHRVCSEVVGLPVGRERAFWARHALEREAPKIDAVVRRWTDDALAAARHLTEKYEWALAARQRRRRSGSVV